MKRLRYRKIDSTNYVSVQTFNAASGVEVGVALNISLGCFEIRDVNSGILMYGGNAASFNMLKKAAKLAMLSLGVAFDIEKRGSCG
jgi:hypothetical protein